MKNLKDKKIGNPRTLLVLILAGEAVFFLPFLVARIFRPTMLAVFGISNTELGLYFSVYGIVAMLSYFFGGPLSDRFHARQLMAISLWLTGLGGFVMISIPSSGVMTLLYGFWGLTTIFLFWAALIRATREWGGPGNQGKAFGFLEGGRGVAAALLGTIAFITFSWFQPDDIGGLITSRSSFQLVLLVISSLTMLIGILVWVYVPENKKLQPGNNIVTRKILSLLKLPRLWLLGAMIISAYSGYKITDDFSLFAREVLGFSEVGAAGIGTLALWLRAIVALLVGLLADKFIKIRIISFCFGLTLISGLAIGLGMLHNATLMILLNLSFTAIGIYGIRTLYFAILKESGISLGVTGTAVGLISFIGYTPEVFIGPWMGQLLDNNPGTRGHQFVFLLLAGFAFVGLIASSIFKKMEHGESLEQDF